MKHLHFPILLLLVALSFFGFHIFLERFHVYFLVWWIDMPMHLGSGFLVALAFLTMIFHDRFGGRTHASRMFVLATALSSAAFVGALWEVYGSFLGHSAPAYGGLFFDTVKDLLCDLLGGALAALLFIGKRYNDRI